MRNFLSVGAFLLCGVASGSRAQEPAGPAPKVFLITIGQGGAYWEKYGHNMLWFYDQSAGIDQAYNWGSFDFAQPGYLKRLLLGDPQYWVDTIPGQIVLDYYRRADRTLVLQELNLTSEQARKAFEYAQRNVREENRYYRYDYFLDNCSTRVRDVIDLAVGGAMKAVTQDTVDQTYHSETARLLDDMKLTQLGVNVALAQPADRKLTVWEDMFIPMRMRDALRGVHVRNASGAMVPLVAREQVLYASQNHHERQDAPRLWLPYLIVGLLLFAALLVVGHIGERSSVVEKVFRFEVALWAFATGMLGVILLGAWLFTQHTFWYHNENLLLVNPLSLFLPVLAPLSIWRPRFLRPAAIVAVIVAMLSAVALVLKGLPWFPQQNLALILMLLPPHFAVAYQLWARSVRAAHR